MLNDLTFLLRQIVPYMM